MQCQNPDVENLTRFFNEPIPQSVMSSFPAGVKSPREIERECRIKALCNLWCQDNIDDAFKALNEIICWATFEFNRGRLPFPCDYDVYFDVLTAFSRSADRKQQFTNEMVDGLSGCRMKYSYIRDKVYGNISRMVNDAVVGHQALVLTRLGRDAYNERQRYISAAMFRNISGTYIQYNPNVRKDLDAILNSFVPPTVSTVYDMTKNCLVDAHTGLRQIAIIDRPIGKTLGYPDRDDVLCGRVQPSGNITDKPLPNGGYAVSSNGCRLEQERQKMINGFSQPFGVAATPQPGFFPPNTVPTIEMVQAQQQYQQQAQQQQVLFAQQQQMLQQQQLMQQQNPNAPQLVPVQNQNGQLVYITIDEYRSIFRRDPPGYRPPAVNLNSFGAFGQPQQPQPQYGIPAGVMPPQVQLQPFAQMQQPMQPTMVSGIPTGFQTATVGTVNPDPSKPTVFLRSELSAQQQENAENLKRLNPITVSDAFNQYFDENIKTPQNPVDDNKNKEFINHSKSYIDKDTGLLYLDKVTKRHIPFIPEPDSSDRAAYYNYKNNIQENYEILADVMIEAGIFPEDKRGMFLQHNPTRECVISWVNRCMTEPNFYHKHSLEETFKACVEQHTCDAFMVRFPGDKKRSSLVTASYDEELEEAKSSAANAVDEKNRIKVHSSNADIDVVIPMTSQTFEELMDEACRMGLHDGIYEHYYSCPPNGAGELQLARVALFRRIVEAKLDNGDDITKPYDGIDYSRCPGVMPDEEVQKMVAEGKLNNVKKFELHDDGYSHGAINDMEIPPVVTNTITLMPEGTPVSQTIIRDNRQPVEIEAADAAECLRNVDPNVIKAHTQFRFNHIMREYEEEMNGKSDEDTDSIFIHDYSEDEPDENGYIPVADEVIDGALNDDGELRVEPNEIVDAADESDSDDLDEVSQDQVKHGVTFITETDPETHLVNTGSATVTNPNFDPLAADTDPRSKDFIPQTVPTEPEVRDVVDDPECSLSERHPVEVTYNDDDIREGGNWIEIELNGEDLKKQEGSIFLMRKVWEAPLTKHEVVSVREIRVNDYMASMDEPIRWLAEYHPEALNGKNPENPRFATLLRFDEVFVYHADAKLFHECVNKVGEALTTITPKTVVSAIEIIKSYSDDISGPLSDILINRFTDAASVTLARRAKMDDEKDAKKQRDVMFYYGAKTLDDISKICALSLEGDWSGDVEDYDFALDVCLQYSFGAIWNVKRDRTIPYLDQYSNLDEAQFLLTHRQGTFRTGKGGRDSSRFYACDFDFLNAFCQADASHGKVDDMYTEAAEKLGSVVGIKVERRMLISNLNLPQCESLTKRKYVTTFAEKQFLMRAFKQWGVFETINLAKPSLLAKSEVVGYDLDNNIAVRYSVAPAN